MSDRFYRKLALLAKIEATYGTDAEPTGALNAILATDVTFTPVVAQEQSRDLLLPYLGQQGIILTGEHERIEFSVEIAGAGTAGTVPAYGALLRACGMAETIVEEESVPVAVEYTPVSGDFEAATFYYNRDGVRHIMVGARGNVTLSLVPSQIPRYRFSFLGLTGTVVDQALPVTDLDGFVTPLPVSKNNTTVSLHGYAGAYESLALDLGQQTAPRMLIGEESIIIGDRQASGTAVMPARSLATINWFERVKSRQRAPLSAIHGSEGGNIVEFTAAGVELGAPTEGQTDGIMNYTLPLMLCPIEGNDDLTIIVR